MRGLFLVRIGCVALALSITAGCGTQRTHEELLRAERTGAVGVAPAAVPTPAPTGTTAPAVPASASTPAAATPEPLAATGVALARPAAGASTARPAAPASTPPAGAIAGAGSTAPPAQGTAAGQASGPGEPQVQPGSPAPPTQDPLRVGMLSTLSGPIGATLLGGTKAAQAWVAYINDRGGLSGHPVTLTLADDGADPARNRALAQSLVEEKKVVAFLMSQAPVSGQGSATYLQQKGIPSIGSEGGSPWFTRNSMFFPQMSSDPISADVGANAMADALLPQKKKVALIYCAEIQGCAVDARSEAFTGVGFDVVFRASVSLASPDFTPQCLAARNAGAEAVFVAIDTQSVARLADNCASVGFKPTYSHFGQISTPDHLKNPNLDGDIISHKTAPYFADSLPAVHALRGAMQKYAPGAPIDGSALTGWAAGKLLERAGQHLTAPTSGAVLEGLWSIADDDLGGLTASLTFQKGNANNGLTMKLCYWVAQIANRRFGLVGDGQRHCRPWDTKLL